MLDKPSLLSRFGEIVGARNVIADPADMARYLVEDRGLFHGRALCVVRPGNVDEVSRIVALCDETSTKIVPQGGNTGLVGGQTPHDTGDEIVLSLLRLAAIREVDASSNTMIVEAGVTLLAAQEQAEKVDRLFPLSLASEGSCTIGGNLSTNAGGTAVLAYGNTRDLVLGLEVVLADGRVLSNLSKLKKDNTGYDLKHLFIGAEGTLGIITAAVLKLFPRPRTRVTAFVGLASPKQALSLLTLAQERTGQSLVTFELIPRIGIDYVLRHSPGSRDPLASAHAWYVMMELASQAEHGLQETAETLLADALERGIAEDAALAASLDQRNAFWRLRENLSEVQKHEGGSIKHDVSVPVATVPAFIEAATETVEAAMPGARVVAFGHLGDGNIHFNVSQPVGADKDAFLARWHEINDVVHAIVARHAGSISAEHGIGRLKRELLPKVKDKVALDVMRALKRTLDPKGLLNPGKVL
ncbi:MAG: FAD-binding oxidoreductase [Methylobacteriaceae bacterium]|nr:FAD-binding oxidoreductase [Methylobacteriaceae bacterium]